jgi:hypothetical protein
MINVVERTAKDTRSRNGIKNVSAEFVKKFKNKQVTDLK